MNNYCHCNDNHNSYIRIIQMLQHSKNKNQDNTSSDESHVYAKITCKPNEQENSVGKGSFDEHQKIIFTVFSQVFVFCMLFSLWSNYISTYFQKNVFFFQMICLDVFCPTTYITICHTFTFVFIVLNNSSLGLIYRKVLIILLCIVTFHAFLFLFSSMQITRELCFCFDFRSCQLCKPVQINCSARVQLMMMVTMKF